MIKIKNISKSFGSKKIFEDFSYTVNDKDFILITGASGSGKSTLLNMIGNLEKYDAGSIEIDGQVINHKETAKYYRNTLTYVFQNYGLIHEASVKDNLFPSLKFSKLKKNEKLSAINDALLKVGLNDVLEQPVFSLSGGEQQRVAIAKAILKPSKIILADEPTGNLDADNAK